MEHGQLRVLQGFNMVSKRKDKRMNSPAIVPMPLLPLLSISQIIFGEYLRCARAVRYFSNKFARKGRSFTYSPICPLRGEFPLVPKMCKRPSCPQTLTIKTTYQREAKGKSYPTATPMPGREKWSKICAARAASSASPLLML